MNKKNCPKCGDQFLINNKTASGLCDNCWNEEVEKLEKRIKRLYSKWLRNKK